MCITTYLKSVINRPCVAGAVLQTLLLLIHSFIHSFSQSVILFLQTFKTSENSNRKSEGAEILRDWSPSTICRMSCVMCQMSRITSHVSCVRYQLSVVIYFVGQSGETRRWRVCCQPGIPPQHIFKMCIARYLYSLQYNMYLQCVVQHLFTVPTVYRAMDAYIVALHQCNILCLNFLMKGITQPELQKEPSYSSIGNTPYHS